MTGAPIDGSIRRAVLSDESSGSVIPDSRKKLDDNPLAIMEPGTEQVAMNFLDQKGLSDNYGNVYFGYGGAGGSSFNVSFNQPDSIDSEADNADDGDILIYNLSQGKYLPSDPSDLGFATNSQITLLQNQINTLDGEVAKVNYPASDGDILVYDVGDEIFEPTSIDSFGFALASEVAKVNYPANDGDILVYNEDDEIFEPKPQTITDYFGFVIEKPTNRSYNFTISLPYEIEIVGTHFSFETGPGSVSFPSGTISAGQPISFTVSSTDSSSAFLTVQIDFERGLGIA